MNISRQQIRRLIAAFVFAAALLIGQGMPSAPQITAEQRAKFWRAQAEYVTASARAQQAQIALDAARAVLDKACDGRLIAAADGEPACAPKPEPPKTGEAK